MAQGRHEFISIGREDWKNLKDSKFENVQAVIHCAYDLKHKISEDPDSLMESNVLATAGLLKLIKKYKIPKLVFISTCAVYGSMSNTAEDSVVFPESLNGIVKILNERMIMEFCKETDIDVKILRVFNMYGGDDQFSIVNHLLKSARSGNVLTLNNDGLSRRDFIHVEDVAKIILKVLESEISDNVINVGTGKSTSIAELVTFVNSLKEINLVKSNKPEIEYSRANIDRMKGHFSYEFKDIFEYLKEELR